uniref:Uncharacterized protein n=1 Tax=Arundo donax TaxID=35708 RepID=A0A0A9FJG3_ARUDO
MLLPFLAPGSCACMCVLHKRAASYYSSWLGNELPETISGIRV